MCGECLWCHEGASLPSSGGLPANLVRWDPARGWIPSHHYTQQGWWVPVGCGKESDSVYNCLPILFCVSVAMSTIIHIVIFVYSNSVYNAV